MKKAWWEYLLDGAAWLFVVGMALVILFSLFEWIFHPKPEPPPLAEVSVSLRVRWETETNWVRLGTSETVTNEGRWYVTSVKAAGGVVSNLVAYLTESGDEKRVVLRSIQPASYLFLRTNSFRSETYPFHGFTIVSNTFTPTP